MTNRERAGEVIGFKVSDELDDVLLNILTISIERALDEAEKRGWGTVNVTFKDAYREGQREMRERAAELCRRKYPCGDPGHDDRYCARCSAIQDGADMLEDEIRALPIEGG